MTKRTTQDDFTELYLDYNYLNSGFDQTVLPLTDELLDKRFGLYSDKGICFNINLKDSITLEWQQGDTLKTQEKYHALKIRNNIYLIVWVSNQNPLQQISILLDLIKYEATIVIAVLPVGEIGIPNLYKRIDDNNELTAINRTIIHAGVGSPKTHYEHQPTTDLVGKRLLCHYESHTYEHIYLNKDLFTWHCVRGGGEGTAEVNPVDYIKIDETLYLFIWREVIASWIGLKLLDLEKNQTTGVLFWNKPFVKDVNHTLIRGKIQFLNQTTYGMDV